MPGSQTSQEVKLPRSCYCCACYAVTSSATLLGRVSAGRCSEMVQCT